MEKMSRHFFGTAGGGSGAVFLSGGVNPVVPTGRIIPENAPGVLKLTRSVRRQLYTADIVFAMSMCLEGRLPKKTRDVLGRVRARVDNINRIIYGGGRFVLSSRDYKKYNRIISEIKTIIMEMSDDNHLDPDFFNAVMLLVEDVYESVQASTSKGLKHEWAMLRRSMGTFCKHVLNEPAGSPGLEFPGDSKIYNYRQADWAGYAYEAMGVALGERFKRVMMA